MEWQGWFSLILTLSCLLILVLTPASPHIVMLGALVILSISGVLGPSEVLQGFSNPGLITIAAMFVVAAGLNSSGGIEILVRKALGQPKHLRSAMLRIFAPVILLSGFLNNTPVVATMIPAIRSWARRINIAPSKLMIPLSYGAILGGTLTLIGSSTNLIINGEYQALTGGPGFPLFFVTVIGLPVTIVAVIFMWLWFPKALPDRQKKSLFGDLREFTLEVSVTKGGPLVGKSIEQAGLRHLPRIYLVEIERDGAIVTAVPSEEILKGGDRLVFTGDTQAISDLLRINGLSPSPENQETSTLEVERAERRLVEAVVSPHCAAIGQGIRDARFRDRYGAVVLAVARNGERVEGNLGTVILKPGDTLLLEARPAFVSRQRYAKDFLLINDLQTESPRHEKAYIAWTILAAIVVLAGTGIISMLNAALLGACLMVITGCCSINTAERSLDLKVLITIGAAFALGMALKKTGVAELIANSVLTVSAGEIWLMLVVVYICVSILTEVITNNGAAILMLPIALTVTDQAGIPHEPFVLAIMMAASASFATPLGYQTNLMVYGPGGYRFSDFLKVGLPMNFLVGMVTVVLLIVFWDLS
ncbi:MAG: SLC13 family permease [Pseudomonadales bacterium]|nr:SLC13 family permease [Pseudomonadales bacterium]